MLALPGCPNDPDSIAPRQLAQWLTIATDPDGIEHVVLSDGWRHIRLDIEAGSLAGPDPVVLHYRLYGIPAAETKILPLRRFLHLCRNRRFSASLFPTDRLIDRGLLLLRVHDALRAGAGHRDIAAALYGTERVERDWREPSESLRSRVRRLISEAVASANGGYRSLMRRIS